MNNLIPEGWQLAPITEFASLKHGHQFRTPDFSETGVRVIKIGQVVGGGKISLKNCDFVRSDVYKETKGFELKGGEILMSLTGNIGRVGIVPYVPYPLLQNYRVGLFSPTNGKCNKEYLAQILGSELVTQQLIDKSNVTAQANFGKADLEQVIVQMPPLPEQQKIATILSSVDNVIEKTRAQIDKLKDLKTGLMQELLTKGIGHTEFKDSPVGRIPNTWNTIPIKSVVSQIIDNRGKTPPITTSGFELLEINTISKHRIYPDYSKVSKFVSLDTYNNWFRAGHPKCGDILIPTVGTIGACSLVDKEKISIAQNIIALRLNELITPEFAYFVLSNEQTVRQIESIVMNAVQPSLRVPHFLMLTIALPPLAEQKQIAESLVSINARLETLLRKNNLLKSIKKALMQDLLTGKVRVNLTDKESAVV